LASIDAVRPQAERENKEDAESANPDESRSRRETKGIKFLLSGRPAKERQKNGERDGKAKL
jgi:hypothetical protein